MQVPSAGRIVHVRIGGPDEAPELRPAIVVRHWSGSCCNVQVFLDGGNDERTLLDNLDRLPIGAGRDHLVMLCRQGTAWLTSISEGEGVGSWRWPARA